MSRKKRRVLIPYATLSGLYLFITILPLFSDVGRNFEYEYAFLVSILTMFALPIFALSIPKKWLKLKPYAYLPSFKFEWLWILLIAPTIFFLPGLIAFNFGLCPCSYNEYNFWMMVQVYPTLVLAHAAMHVVLRLRMLKIKLRKIILAAVTIYAALLLALLGSFWFQPQVRMVDLLVGFIHGPIYDNWIPVDNGLIAVRSAHLFIALAILLAAWYQPHRRQLFIGGFVACFLGYLVSSISASDFPSVSSGKRQLDKLLPFTIEDEHFTLHFQNDKVGSGPPHMIKQIALEAKFHYSELSKFFAPDLPRVEIYVYPDANSKKLWFGGGATDITDVHTPSIHINSALFPHPSLRHELVHAIASENAYHGLGFHPNLAFTEGLAVALAPEENGIGLHDGAAALVQSNRLPKISHLFSLFFWTKAGARAYTAAGSLVDFLIKTRGFDPVKQMYEGKSWDKVMDKPKNQILAEWKDFVLKNFDENRHKLYAESLFRYPGVLNSLCPHSKALLIKSRKGNPVLRLRQPIGWDPEKDYWQWRVQIGSNDRYALLERWREQIRRLNTQRVVEKHRLQVWQKALEQASYWPPKTTEDVEMLILHADIERILAGRNSSVPLLEKIFAYSLTQGIGDSLLRQVQVRLEIERQAEEAQALAWIRFLAGWREKIPDKPSYQDEPWILKYLRVRAGDKLAVDVEYLLKALPLVPPENLANTFKIEWYKFLGHRAMQLNAFALAGQSYHYASRFATSANKEFFQMNERAASYFSKTELSAERRTP